MPKRPRRRPARPAGGAADAPPRAVRVAAGLVGLATFLALLVVDARAEASFDAPKRLVALAGVALAFAVAAAAGRLPLGRPRGRRRLALGALAAAAALAAGSAALSPYPEVAWDALRAVALGAGAAVVCAAPAVSAPAWRAVGRGFVAGAAVDAATALLQWAGALDPFDVVRVGGRGEAAGWIGNTGVLGLVVAFASVLLVPALAGARTAGRRTAIAALLALLLAGLAVSGSVTALAALGVGAVVAALLLLRSPRARRLVALGAALAVAAGGGVLLAGRGGRTLNQTLTYRLGPWAAAAEMALERPALGWGAGTFEAEYAAHAVAAELRWQERLANPALAGSYAEAHNDLLQAAAEVGIPATLLALTAIGMALAPLARGPAGGGERAAVLAVLAAGAVAALAWFPFQRPGTALLLAAAVGRAWRLAADAETEAPDAPAARPGRAARWAGAALALAALLLALPELPRHAAERRLAELSAALQTVAAASPPGPGRAAGLRRIAARAAALDTHPGDPRPANVAGTATMLAGDPEAAAAIFTTALAAGERPELLANLGLAHAAAGEQEAAQAAMLRAAWISPMMAPPLEQRSGFSLRPRLAELESRLAAGELTDSDLPPSPLPPPE